MKDFFEKLLNAKGLPIKLVGTTVIEVCLFCLTILGIVSLLTYLWSSSGVILLWLFFLTLWAFLHIKKSVLTQERFDEIDQRDMDFKDECDRYFAKLSKLQNQIATQKDPEAIKAEADRLRQEEMYDIHS